MEGGLKDSDQGRPGPRGRHEGRRPLLHQRVPLYVVWPEESFL